MIITSETASIAKFIIENAVEGTLFLQANTPFPRIRLYTAGAWLCLRLMMI